MKKVEKKESVNRDKHKVGFLDSLKKVKYWFLFLSFLLSSFHRIISFLSVTNNQAI